MSKRKREEEKKDTSPPTKKRKTDKKIKKITNHKVRERDTDIKVIDTGE